MSAFVPPAFSAAVPQSRSLGTKLFLIILLALGMSLSGLFLSGLTEDRATEHSVQAAVSDSSSQQPTNVFGIRLVDSYRSMHRSLHYIALFIGLVFLTYFVFEALSGRSVHPAQYALVGVAQVIFYLLLLSLAEHLGFDLSYLVAGAATVALFSLNTDWVFHSRKLAARALFVFAALYAFIYVLLRVEAYALLVGAFASFAAIAAAMYVTRNIDWYGNRDNEPHFAGANEAPARESWLE